MKAAAAFHCVWNW